MTEEITNLFRIFLVGADAIQKQFVGSNLIKNRCVVNIYDNVSDIPPEAVTDSNFAPYAIIAPNKQIPKLKKNDIFAALLQQGRPLIALCDTMYADRETTQLNLTSGEEISYIKVKQLASPEILRLLCEIYEVDKKELPMLRQRG